MKYCTGKHPKVTDPRTLRMGAYVTAQLPPPPVAYDVLPRIGQRLGTTDPTVLWPMDGNDRYGDCTFAAKAHAVTTYRGLIGTRDILPAEQVIAAYLAFTGGEDSGCAELDVLNDWRQDGDKILAYAAINPKNHINVMHAISIFGGVYLGCELQETAEDDFDARRIWTPGTPTGNGHAVFATAYDLVGVTLLTWGNTQRATWGWWDAAVDESYVILAPEASDPTFCPGFDVTQLQQDLAVVTK